MHKPLQVLAGGDGGDRGHEGTGHFPETGALLRGDTYTHGRRHTKQGHRHKHTHTPPTPSRTRTQQGGAAGVAVCVCVSQAKKPRHPDTHPSTPLHRDAVVNERISAQLPSPSSSSSFLGEKVARFQRVVVGDSQPGLVTLRLGGWWVGRRLDTASLLTEPPPFLSGTE